MAKYEIVSDSEHLYTGMTIDYIIDDFTIGRKLMFMKEEYTLQQNGKILVLGRKERVISLMVIEEPVAVEKPKLVINKTLDLFFETKKVRVTVDCTYKELYDALYAEKVSIEKLTQKPFMFEYDAILKSFLFMFGWGFEGESMLHLTEGSYVELEEGDTYKMLKAREG